MGIYKRLIQKGISKFKSSQANTIQPPPKEKADYTPVIIGAVGVLIIAGLIYKNKK